MRLLSDANQESAFVIWAFSTVAKASAIGSIEQAAESANRKRWGV